MKYLLMLDTPFWMCLVAVLTVWNFRLRARIRNSGNPLLTLPKKERRQRAREQLNQAKEDKDLEQLERTTRVLKGEPLPADVADIREGYWKA